MDGLNTEAHSLKAQTLLHCRIAFILVAEFGEPVLIFARECLPRQDNPVKFPGGLFSFSLIKRILPSAFRDRMSFCLITRDSRHEMRRIDCCRSMHS